MFGKGYYLVPWPSVSDLMLSFNTFFAAYAFSLLAAALVGVSLVARRGIIRKVLSAARQNSIFIVLLVLLPMLVLAVDTMDLALSNADIKETQYTGWFMQISGGAVNALQTRLNYSLLIDLSVFFYVWIFAFVIFFSPTLLLVKGDGKTFRRYSVAMAVNYMIMIPFYILFPVGVSSGAPGSSVVPLLYVHPNWGRLITSIDPLNNNFPSGHTSLMLTTLLIFVFAQSRYRGYSTFLGIATAWIVVSVIILGIHWPPDVLMGAGVAVLALYVSRIDRVVSAIDKVSIPGLKRKKVGSSEQSFVLEDPMVYPRGNLALSTYSHQFIVGTSEGLPVSLMPGSIRLNQALYIHHTNLRRAETDEVREALPVGIRTD